MSTAGLVLGMTGLAFCIAGLIAFYPILLVPLFVVVGLPLSGAGFYQARKDGTSLVAPVAGLAAGAVAAAVSTPLGFIFAWVVAGYALGGPWL